MNEIQTALLAEIKNIDRLVIESANKILNIENAISTQESLANDLAPNQDTSTPLKNHYQQALAENALGSFHDIKSIELTINKAQAADDKVNKQRIEDKKNSIATIEGLETLLEMEKTNLEAFTNDAKQNRLSLLNLIAKEHSENYEEKALAAIESLRELLAVDSAISHVSGNYKQTSGLLHQGNFELSLPSIISGSTLTGMNGGYNTMLIDTSKHIVTGEYQGHRERTHALMAMFE